MNELLLLVKRQESIIWSDKLGNGNINTDKRLMISQTAGINGTLNYLRRPSFRNRFLLIKYKLVYRYIGYANKTQVSFTKNKTQSSFKSIFIIK